MGIKIVPHGPDKKDLVELFNRRMREAGSPWGFYVDPRPSWIPKREGVATWREYFLAVENDAAVVGGFALKPQDWMIGGERRVVTDWQGPFSLGAIDNRYAALGLRMLRDMLKRYPLLYSWGHGGNEEPVVQMLRKMGWLMHETPFLLRVVRPFNFLRKNKYLRQDSRRAIAQDVLAFTGMGSVGLHTLHLALRARSLKRFDAKPEITSSFGPWADEIWERAHGRYDAVAVRDATTMNHLVPGGDVAHEWPAPTRLRVTSGGRTLGWAVTVAKQLEGDARFGDLRVGMIADYFGLPEDAGPIVHAAFDHLRDDGVDLVVANQAHPAWVQGFVDSGFLAVEGRRLFCASPELEKALAPFEQTHRGLFLSNMDGHGPVL
jgi:hypothetical protein